MFAHNRQKPNRLLLSCAALLAPVLAPTLALAQSFVQLRVNDPWNHSQPLYNPPPPTTPLAPNEFGIWFDSWSDRPQWWNLDLRGARFRTDNQMLYGGWFGNYPRQGLHIIELYAAQGTAEGSAERDARREQWMQQHLAVVRSKTLLMFPDPNYAGLACIDYEYLPPFLGPAGYPNAPNPGAPLEAMDDDLWDDWKETLQQTRPQAFAQAGSNATSQAWKDYCANEFLLRARQFAERTFWEVKNLRPNAKVGFYGWPTQTYWHWWYPERATEIRRNHDQAQWLWDMVDVVFPSAYPLYDTVPDGTRQALGQDTLSNLNRYIMNNVLEAKRVAAGKPVYLFITMQYHPSHPSQAYMPVNDINMRRQFELPRELGVNGVIIWGHIQTQEQYEAMNTFYSQRLIPFLSTFQNLPSLAEGAQTGSGPVLTAPAEQPTPFTPGSGNNNNSGNNPNNNQSSPPNNNNTNPSPSDGSVVLDNPLMPIDLPPTPSGNTAFMEDLVYPMPANPPLPPESPNAPLASPSNSNPTNNTSGGGGGGGGGGAGGGGGGGGSGGAMINAASGSGGSSSQGVMTFRRESTTPQGLAQQISRPMPREQAQAQISANASTPMLPPVTTLEMETALIRAQQTGLASIILGPRHAGSTSITAIPNRQLKNQITRIVRPTFPEAADNIQTPTTVISTVPTP